MEWHSRVLVCRGVTKNIKPLSPDSDQHQYSPNNIHMLPREIVMRVNKMITFTKFSQLFFKEMYEGQYGEFICGYRGLKG